MKLLLRLTPMLLVIMGLLLFAGCEDTDDEEVNPLVGTWAISNLSQMSTYTFADSSFAPFNFPGDTAASGGLTWAQFSAMGVSGTVTMIENGTFTLDGNFPIASDTLGMAPSIVPLTDSGSWTEGEYEGNPTLTIDGAFYDLGGLMTLSEDENMITLAYQSAEVETLYVPAGPHYWPAPLTVVTQSILGFTRE